MKLMRTAQMTWRDLKGRKWIIAALLLIPLVFYVSRRTEASWQGIRTACMGLAWAVSTISLFSTRSSHGIEPRLRMAGIPTTSLFFGRFLALSTLSLLAGGYACVMIVDQAAIADQPGITHYWAVAAALFVSALIAVPLGMLIGTLIPRDLEGMLVLITIVGVQTIIDPGQGLARILPLWSTREFLSYGIEGSGNLADAWTHAGCYWLALMVAGFAITTIRLRNRRHLTFEPVGQWGPAGAAGS